MSSETEGDIRLATQAIPQNLPFGDLRRRDIQTCGHKGMWAKRGQRSLIHRKRTIEKNRAEVQTRCGRKVKLPLRFLA